MIIKNRNILLEKTSKLNYDTDWDDIEINTRDIRLLGPYLYYKYEVCHKLSFLFIIKNINKSIMQQEMIKPWKY